MAPVDVGLNSHGPRVALRELQVWVHCRCRFTPGFVIWPLSGPGLFRMDYGSLLPGISGVRFIDGSGVGSKALIM